MKLQYLKCPRCKGPLDFTPGTSDVRYLPNGDPGYPGDPAEIECPNTECNFGEDEAEYDDVLVSAEEEVQGYADEAADRWYDEWKDEEVLRQ